MTPDYLSLIERLADAEPNSGYADPSRLELSDADVALILRERPSLLANAVSAGEDARQLARRVADMLPAIDERPEYILAGIGAVIVDALRRQARQAIFVDVFATSLRREFESRATCERRAAHKHKEATDAL